MLRFMVPTYLPVADAHPAIGKFPPQVLHNRFVEIFSWALQRLTRSFYYGRLSFVPRDRLLPTKVLMKQDTTTTTHYHFYKIRVVIPTTRDGNLGFNEEIEECCCNFPQIVPVKECVN